MAAPVVVAPRSRAVVGDSAAVAVELQFQGVGGLFRGFFTEPDLVAQLWVELGPCVEGGLAVVVITWSEETRIGTISLAAEPATLACFPGAGPGVDLAPLEPVGRALANFRDGVSGRFDVRVASFRTGVKVLSGMHHCAFWSGGQYPPDGSLWRRCADFAGNETCMPGERHDGVTSLRFDAEQEAYAKACFGR